MSEILAVTLSSMQHDVARLDRIAANVANASTPSYQAQAVTSRPGRVDFNQLLGEYRIQAPATSEVTTDQRAGPLRATGQPLDLALTTPGYFEVLTDKGVAYTRQGDFKLDGQGRLTTQAGQLVMGKGGPITLTRPDPRIDPDGSIYEPGASPDKAVAQLKLVQFDEPSRLTRLGGGLYVPTASNGLGGNVAQPSEGAVRVRQAHLEGANVQTANEMMQLVQTMRHFESLQRVATGYDEMLGTAVRKLGELS